MLCGAVLLSFAACGPAEAEQTPAPPLTTSATYSYERAVTDALTYISDYSILASMMQTEDNERFGSVSPSPMWLENKEGTAADQLLRSDGTYLYILTEGELSIFTVDGQNSREISRITVDSVQGMHADQNQQGERTPVELFVSGGKLAVVFQSTRSAAGGENGAVGSSVLSVEIYDVTDPASPVLDSTFGQDGVLSGAALENGVLYLVSAHEVDAYDQANPDSYVPHTYVNHEARRIPAKNISVMPTQTAKRYAVVCAYDLEKEELLSAQAAFGAGNLVCFTQDAVFIAGNTAQQISTASYEEGEDLVTERVVRPFVQICRYSITDGMLEPGATVTLEGKLKNASLMNCADGTLTVATQVEEYIYRETQGGEDDVHVTGEIGPERYANLCVLREDTLKCQTIAEKLAEGAELSGIYFGGEWTYLAASGKESSVLAVNAAGGEPQVVSKLQITGFPGQLLPWSDSLIFGFGDTPITGNGSGAAGENGLKLVMLDLSNASNPSIKSVLPLEDSRSAGTYAKNALFLDAEKNIIAFPADGVYDIYSWTDKDGFIFRHRIETGDWAGPVKSITVGDYSYLLAGETLTVINVRDFIIAGRYTV